MRFGGEVPEFFSKYIFYFLVSTESLKKYCHYFNFPKVWWGAKPIGGGPWPPGPYGSYGPEWQ